MSMHALELPEVDLARLSARLSGSMLRGLVGQQTHIRGDELPGISPHRQLNRFILLHIQQDLAEYLNRHEHPYFDHTHAEVRQARDTYARLLSHHIRLDRATLQQLAERAAYHSLKLLLNPGPTFELLLFGSRPLVPRTTFDRLVGYFVYFDYALQALQAHYHLQPEDTIAKVDFRAKLDRAVLLHAEQLGIPTLTYRQDCYRALTGEALPLEAQDPAPAKALEAGPAPLAEPVSVPVQHKPARLQVRQRGASNPSDLLEPSNLPLHVQFSFVQRLFKGDTDRFRSTMAHLNTTPHYAAALAYLERELITPELQQREAATLSEFLDLVRARFEVSTVQ